MIPYLAGYLALRSPDGECCEIFNSCRTIANFYKEGRAAGWEANAEPTVWDGYCNWAWNDEDYSSDDVVDPWYDPHDPATTEVAGFLVDPPDEDGHGFYLEPSGSKRVLSASRFEPLEMFFTGSIVSCTSRGEAAFLRWMDKTLRNCSAGCGGWEAQVFAHYPCEEDFVDALFDDDGVQVVVGDTGEPARPDPHCEKADSLLPGGLMAPYLDTGERTVRKVVYRGFEQLDEGLDECYGNRYKFCFDVFDYCTVKPGLLVADFDAVWDDCHCLDTNRFTIGCREEYVPCGESVDNFQGVTAPIIRSNDRPKADNLGGLIALPGRYVRPDKVNLRSVLTPIMGKGLWKPRVVIDNLEGDSFNVRVSVWRAIDNVPPPDTDDGWCVYGGLDPCWRGDIAVVRENQNICINTDCTSTVTCQDGSNIDGSRFVDVTDNLIQCSGRYWVTVEACCGEPNNYGVKVYMHQVEDL